MSRAAASRASVPREHMASLTPSLASAVATARPRPFDDAATIATRSLIPRSKLTPQIGIVPAQPVLPGRREDVHVIGVFQRLGAVRHVRWNHHDFTGVNHHGAAVDLKFQRAADDESNLLVLVLVLGNHGAFL